MGIEGSAPTTTHSGGRHANATPITKEWSRTSKAAKNAEPNAAVPTNEATTGARHQHYRLPVRVECEQQVHLGSSGNPGP